MRNKKVLLFISILFLIFTGCLDTIDTQLASVTPVVEELNYVLIEKDSPAYKAIITWTTQELADCTVTLYDETMSVLFKVSSTGGKGKTDRSVTIDNLESQKQYYFDVTAVITNYKPSTSSVISVYTPKHPLKYNIDIYPKTMPDAENNYEYLIMLAAYDYNGEVTFTSSDLPSWLTLNDQIDSKAELIGTPRSIASNVTFNITATDLAGNTETIEYIIDVTADSSPIYISPDTLPNPERHIYYNLVLQAINTEGTYEFTSADLPAWLTLDTDGSLYGTSHTEATHTFTIRLEDEYGNFKEQTYTITVQPDPTPITITPEEITLDPERHSYYEFNLSAYNYFGTIAFTSLDLPAWLTLDTDGTLYGTPHNEETVTFNITVTDDYGDTDTNTFELTVTADSTPFEVLPNAPNDMIIDIIKEMPYYNAKFYTINSIGTVSYNIDFNLLNTSDCDSWMTIDINGNIVIDFVTLNSSGTAGTCNFTIEADDDYDSDDTGEFNINVYEKLEAELDAALPPWLVADLDRQIIATGGTGSYTFELFLEPDPARLEFNWINQANGEFRLTPVASGMASFAIKVSDANYPDVFIIKAYSILVFV